MSHSLGEGQQNTGNEQSNVFQKYFALSYPLLWHQNRIANAGHATVLSGWRTVQALASRKIVNIVSVITCVFCCFFIYWFFLFIFMFCRFFFIFNLNLNSILFVMFSLFNLFTFSHICLHKSKTNISWKWDDDDKLNLFTKYKKNE